MLLSKLLRMAEVPLKVSPSNTKNALIRRAGGHAAGVRRCHGTGVIKMIPSGRRRMLTRYLGTTVLWPLCFCVKRETPEDKGNMVSSVRKKIISSEDQKRKREEKSDVS